MRQYSSAEIAAKLEVAHLLEGSVRCDGNEVRISVELVNASDGSTAWSQHYDRPFKDLFKLQDNVAHDVAPGRIEAALAAGGRLLDERNAPSWWVLADADGNEVCLSTWQGREGAARH